VWGLAPGSPCHPLALLVAEHCSGVSTGLCCGVHLQPIGRLKKHDPLWGGQVDLREYGVAAHILRHLGVRSIRLMTNNTAKYNSMKAYGIAVTERLPLLPTPAATAAQPAKPKPPAAHGALHHRNGSEPHFV
jgi:hypothetical protein